MWTFYVDYLTQNKGVRSYVQFLAQPHMIFLRFYVLSQTSNVHIRSFVPYERFEKPTVGRDVVVVIGTSLPTFDGAVQGVIRSSNVEQPGYCFLI